MRIISSYGVELLNVNHVLKPTISIYRKAVSYLIQVFHQEWAYLSSIPRKLTRTNAAENLVHSTKNNEAKYDFDDRFPKFPVYLRRAAQEYALGCVSSYHRNYEIWENNGRQGKEPYLQPDRNIMPCFYYARMYQRGENDYEGKLKIYWRGNWIWITVQLNHTDVNYLKKHWTGAKASAPVLERRNGKYYLRFSFEEQVALKTTAVLNQTVCAIDLGMNTDAVCSTMKADGTILDRKFIDFPTDKNRIRLLLNRMKRIQQKSGAQSIRKYWGFVTRLNDGLARKTASAIIEYAENMETDVIVFAYPEKKGSFHGNRKQQFLLWKRSGVQKMVEHAAHRRGMRVSRVCGRYASKLAYDGSGPVVRDKTNHSLCTFTNGKQYHVDLSASYNLGARYFIRELLKSFPAKERSQLLAKVPEAERRTSCTYATLLSLRDAMEQ